MWRKMKNALSKNLFRESKTKCGGFCGVVFLLLARPLSKGRGYAR